MSISSLGEVSSQVLNFTLELGIVFRNRHTSSWTKLFLTAYISGVAWQVLFDLFELALNRNIGALVYYACPFVFDRSDLYSKNVDLSKLRLADLTLCPSIYSDNDSHFTYYSDESAPPIWCSEPAEGRALEPKDMVKEIETKISSEAFGESQINLLDELSSVSDVEAIKGTKREVKLYELVSESLIIIRSGEHENS